MSKYCKIIIITLFVSIGTFFASLAFAAFPTISGTNSGNSANATSHTINLPSTISAGDLLIVSFSTDGNPVVTFPADWSVLFSAPNGTANNLAVAYKIADGTEGATINVSTDASESSAHTSYRITGHYAGIGPAFGTYATGSSVNPNPPSLTTSWGAADNLWLAIYGWDYNRTHTSYPTNYTLSQLSQIYNTTQGCGVASAGYNLNIATQDPGTGTIGTADTWVANTLAVRPFGSSSTITLASGTDASSATVAPSSGIRDAGSFTLQSSANPDYVTAMTVTLASSGTPYDGISEVRITNNDGSITYFSTVTNPTSNSVSFSGGRGIPITSTQAQFKIRITPKNHANMPVPNGASYVLSPYVSDWTLSYADTKNGSDSNSNTLTIDNTSPSGATNTSGAGGVGNVDLNWTTSASSDFSKSVVLRWSGSVPGSEVPAEGIDYNLGDTISTATVACVRTADSASTAITDAIDGISGGGGCLTTSLAAGNYSYRVFQKDSNGNYDTGSTFTGSPFNVTSDSIKIYRSVRPNFTYPIFEDEPEMFDEISVSSGIANYSMTFDFRIGVGDVLIVDTDNNEVLNSSDTILFVHGIINSQNITVRNHLGAIPSNISVNDRFAFYSAYTSLSNAEAGTINSTLSGMGFSFNGGNRDLVTNNEQWNIACYANGTIADGYVTFLGWTTSEYNYIKIYTPESAAEVWISQRHSGKWDSSYYYIEDNQEFGDNIIFQNVGHVIVEGIQISRIINSDAISNNGISFVLLPENSRLILKNNIIRCVGTGSQTHTVGIKGANSSSSTIDIYNNIIYGFKEGEMALMAGIWIDDGDVTLNIYNNTIYDCNIGINNVAGTVRAKNNITQNCNNGFNGTFDLSSNYNISDLSSDAPGANSKNLTNVEFLNENGRNFHLSQSDTAARGAGANLTSDSNLSITTDIDDQLRNPSGIGWDIGADEGTMELVTTVMQSGGNFSTLSSWEDAIDSDLVANTTRVFSHGGITGAIVGGNTVTGQTSGATATVVYATSTQILLSSVSGVFQSGETVQVSVGNSVVISDNGNPASVVAKIDGAWTVADTTASLIDGWITGPDNYIKIYTTTTARHSGKWDTGKYRLEISGTGIQTYEKYIKIDGLQIRADVGISLYYIDNYYSGYNTISNNIIKDYDSVSSWNYGIRTYASGGDLIFNNIVYDYNYDDTNEGIMGSSYFSISYYYNNTVHNSYYGFRIQNSSTNVILKNNIAQNCTDGFGGGNIISDYNISDVSGDAPNATFANGFGEVKFANEANEDFHLHTDDKFAKDAGTDLSNYFTTDIEGIPRLGSWDIGADELPTQIYRSVGPGKTDTLDNDTGHTKNVTLTTGRATFSASAPDNIGVGDVVIIDTNNDNSITSADTLLFIHKRNDGMSYELRTQTGTIPANIANNDTYQIYRAYTSLSNAEAGTINSTLSGMGFTFNGGNRDLITNNEQWNTACYANGTTADVTGVVINGWVTGQNNFIRIYTPTDINEVGLSQRHDGKWDENKYRLELSLVADVDTIEILDDYIKIEGLQFNHITDQFNSLHISMPYTSSSGTVEISDNIFKAIYSGTGYGTAILAGSNVGIAKIYNNIFYDFKNGVLSGGAITLNNSSYKYVYNNTIYNSYYGFDGNQSTRAFLKNNITQNCDDGFLGSFHTDSNYNISDLAADAPGGNSKNSTNVLFIDEANNNFCLDYDDTAARGAGLNFSNDTILPFSDDIRGQARPKSPEAWSIGACESQSAGKLKMEGDQIKMEGSLKFE